MSTTQSSIRLLGICLAIHFVTADTTQARPYSLTDDNSSMAINPNAHSGITDWAVDGQSQLYQQLFWFRTGGSGGEKPLNSLNLVSVDQSSPGTLSTLYRSPGNSSGNLSIEVSYTLLGSGIGTGGSTLNEQIKVTNLSDKALDFHFFQYVGFGGTQLGDTVQLGQSLAGSYDAVSLHNGRKYFADATGSLGAQHAEAGSSHSILAKLEGGSPTTLDGTTGPFTGDAAWAFQWDANIPVGGSFDVALSQSVYVVPEPAALAFIPVGLIALGYARRRLLHSGK